ncbi:MAG TPA: adenylate/guanylate cyclase domain-containing protein [Methylomirabilota bacterium]|nr:adenylate/guanylate cyclase domain-containing protein [Methylomirabilota bacterium]
MQEPVRYAASGEVHIAYRVFGAGSRDIVLIPGTLSHVELLWEVPSNEHLLKRLTTFARVIVFDKRGQGLSDRVAEQTLEERIGDVRAVMDAAGSERATIYGWSEGGPMCLMFAATYPERTSALVLYGTFASMKGEPWGVTPDVLDRFLGALQRHWGEGALLQLNAPSRRDDPAFVEHFSRIERAAASPGSVRALMRANYDIDVRSLLPTLRVPTLILHRVDDGLVPVRAGRYLAEHIPGARYAEIPGSDHLVLDLETQDVIADQIEEFITGGRRRLEADRVVATVMFTDIVGSTERAAQIGDRRWRELRAEWHEMMRRELAAFRGREVDTAGDGLLATFDGPARAIRCACSVRERVHALGLQVRTGLHTGECELGGAGVVGIAVHIGARVAALAGPDEVLVSSTVRDLVAGSGLEFVDRGSHALKGVPGDWRLFVVP